jgi:hypothetical protein
MKVVTSYEKSAFRGHQLCKGAIPGRMAQRNRYVGRDRAAPRPDGWAITRQRLAEAVKMVGSVVLGPRR